MRKMFSISSCKPLLIISLFFLSGCSIKQFSSLSTRVEWTISDTPFLLKDYLKGSSEAEERWGWEEENTSVILQQEESRNIICQTRKNKVVNFGDSITEGQGASVPSKSWSYLVASSLGLEEDNQGVGGTILQDSPPGLSRNGKSRYVIDVLSKCPKKVFILYGLNDLRYDGAEGGKYSSARFKEDLSTIVSDLINHGLKPEDIALGSPPYIDPANQYAFLPSISKQREYRAAVESVAYTYKTRYTDIYEAMVKGGGNTLLADGIHPNDKGHALIAKALLNSQVPKSINHKLKKPTALEMYLERRRFAH